MRIDVNDLKLMVAKQVYGDHINRETIELFCRDKRGSNTTYGRFSIGSLPPFIHIRSSPVNLSNSKEAKNYAPNLWYEILIDLKEHQMTKHYISKNHCTECDTVLTPIEELYSNGMCPYCGKKSESTIVDTNKVVYELIPPTKWWHQFFKKYKRKSKSL